MHTVGKIMLAVVASITVAATSPVSTEAIGPGGDTSTMRSLGRSLHRAQHGARRMYLYQHQEEKPPPKQLSAPPGSGEKPACQNNCVDTLLQTPAQTAPTTD